MKICRFHVLWNCPLGQEAVALSGRFLEPEPQHNEDILSTCLATVHDLPQNKIFALKLMLIMKLEDVDNKFNYIN